jgi:Uncharacterized protein conserved in bacteria (DUF2252)
MTRLAGMHHLEVWYLHADVDAARGQVAARASSERLRMFEAKVAKMRRKTRMRAFSKLTERVDGKLRIASDPPVLVPIKQLAGGRRQAAEDRIREVVDSYRRSLSPARRHQFDGYRCTAPCEYPHQGRRVVVGTTAHAVDQRDPARLDDRGRGSTTARVTSTSASSATRRARDYGPRRLRLYVGACAAILARLRRSDRDRRLPRQQRRHGSRNRQFRGRIRRPERARLPRTPSSGRRRQDYRRTTLRRTKRSRRT